MTDHGQVKSERPFFQAIGEAELKAQLKPFEDSFYNYIQDHRKAGKPELIPGEFTLKGLRQYAKTGSAVDIVGTYKYVANFLDRGEKHHRLQVGAGDFGITLEELEARRKAKISAQELANQLVEKYDRLIAERTAKEQKVSVRPWVHTLDPRSLPVDDTAPAPTDETEPATTEETAPAPAPAKVETTKLFIGNLDSYCKAGDLEDKLRGFGEVSEFVFKGKFAFVHYVNRSDAMKALGEMQHDSTFGFRGNPLKVEEANANQPNKSRHIMVRGLPESITEDKLKEHYSAYGEVEGVKILAKREEHYKMACFIDFASEDAAAKAIESQAPIDGEAVEVKPHRSKRDQRRDYGFGGGGRDRGYGGGGRDRGYSGNDGGGDRYDRGYRGGGYNDSGQYGGVYADRDRRGGYDDRSRGSYDDRRGRGGYDDRRGRGGYDDRRGGGGGGGGHSYDDRRGGGGGYEGRRSRSPSSHTAKVA